MSELFKKPIQHSAFPDPAVNAMMNLLVAAGYLRDKLEVTCETFGITLSQYSVLRILRGAIPNGFSRTEIVQRMVEKAPDVTRLVDRLEQQRLVERRRPAEDRRLSVTRITDAGLALLNRVEPEVHAVEDRYFAKRVGEMDCRSLSRICEDIYGNTDLGNTDLNDSIADSSPETESPLVAHRAH
jgi:DNA-binding MarR family transcriptional regulator